MYKYLLFQFQYYWNHVRVKRKTDLTVDRKRALFVAAANRYLLGDIGGGANGVMDMDEDLTIALDNQQLYNDLLATTNSVRAGLRVSEFLIKNDNFQLTYTTNYFSRFFLIMFLLSLTDLTRNQNWFYFVLSRLSSPKQSRKNYKFWISFLY